MKKKGYFKDIVDTMTLQEILDNCEVVKQMWTEIINDVNFK